MQLRITQGKGFHVVMDNGVTLSVQIGPGNYSDNYNEPFRGERDRDYVLPPSSTAEIAVWIKGGSMLELPSCDTVAGYVPVSDVFRAIARLMALTDPTPEEVVDALGLTEE